MYPHRLDTYYIGVTTDVQGRLRRHLSSRKGFTSRAKDWIVMYTETYREKNQAYAREKEIKRHCTLFYICFSPQASVLYIYMYTDAMYIEPDTTYMYYMYIDCASMYTYMRYKYIYILALYMNIYTDFHDLCALSSYMVHM
ncbi:GIY-YIG nuclease family protein [Parapusillimonas sp. SGNA-6]|nr:GIY-YIG nuclease family protein [Parapedobacter sp. SGR-10]NGM89166.1 GIY-YIG nuclease family protein [Parapusillimonas sp. SGNA-6]